MSRQSSDSLVNHSSIALLQERFKQLQRVKEMREERELSRQLSESQRVNSTTYDPSTLFFHSEIILAPRPPHQGPPSLQHNLQSKNDNLRATEIPTLANLQYSETVMYRSSNCEDSDIDTSLHL
ncbi:hypothetical protein LOK49_LG06G00362 [Camellia lanceoleosa]|uniref:Uncharacterized protein n=1 Tax=Camellia lanceoleosa TaxID=1840588 RepID=A0ACC0H7L3_9ERIC|nr:hypothetical protein LOK49_LG06G00362 [Camellia lanceoleosa]